ncbi:uncharacterized protein LOC108099680 [Drosophila ficusphila]|uniref:uncharacterized protein LOC108099680 n=1 Tax=Drosophila ficusphila TaxID=30025 RepID=UPI0007E76A6C|nr:uncharacterized protein LOC108099680 [Drosophila ficusphila]
MGAEQSASLACTQTGKQEEPLKLINSELFFRLYFDKMPLPVTGPVTESLYQLVESLNQTTVANDETQSNQEEDNNSMESEDSESGFYSEYSDESCVSCSISSTSSYSDVEIESLQTAEFDSIDEYDMPNPESFESHLEALPVFDSQE